MMNIINKIICIVLIGTGIAIWMVDYLVFTTIGALTAWIAHTAGITGLLVLGVQIVGWILMFSIMLFLLIAGLCVVLAGIRLLFE